MFVMQALRDMYARLDSLPKGRRKVRRIYAALLHVIRCYDHPAIDDTPVDTSSFNGMAERARRGMEVLALYAPSDRQAAKLLAACEHILACDTPYVREMESARGKRLKPAYKRIFPDFS